MKICSKCKQEKSFDCFNKTKRSKTGYQSYCKDCAKLYYKTYEVSPKLDISEGFKDCSKCGSIKPLSEFNARKSSLDGLESHCRECANEGARKWREENPDKVSDYKCVYNEENREKLNESAKRYRHANQEKVIQNRRKYEKSEPHRSLYYDARRRAKEKNLDFNIELSDVVVPEICPVLGIPIIPKSTVNNRDFAPSIDRIIPQLGYVKGNIAVISYRANRLKSNSHPSELRIVADWLESKINQMSLDTPPTL